MRGKMAVARPKAVSRKPARPSKQDDIEIVKATRDIKVHTPAQGFSDEDEEDDDVVLGGEVMDEDMSDDSAAGSSDESDNDQVFDDVPASASLPRGSMAGVANAMSALLNQNMPQVEAPILAKERSRAHEIEKEKREYKERKAAAHERRMLRIKEHVEVTSYSAVHEKLLRRVSTRGVVKLFNAINQQQRVIENAVSKTKTSTEREKVAQLSQQGFLDLLKTTGEAKPAAAAAPKSSFLLPRAAESEFDAAV